MAEIASLAVTQDIGNHRHSFGAGSRCVGKLNPVGTDVRTAVLNVEIEHGAPLLFSVRKVGPSNRQSNCQTVGIPFAG